MPYNTETQAKESKLTNSKLEMLSAREQLMEDIDCIIDGFFYDTWGDEYYNQDREELVKTLCDAVCRNFPSN